MAHDHDPPADADAFLTLAAAGEAELKVQRSRFMAYVLPAADEAAARAAIAEVARRHHDCRHVCHAWRLGRGADTVEVRSDAGEPSGSAGEPILGALRQAGVTDAVAVVARWFGGVKLGTGGLGRAYRDAAAAALAAAPRREVRLGRRGELRLAYEQQKTLRRLIEEHDGRLEHEDFAADVTWRIWLPLSRWEPFAAALVEVTAGRTKIRALD